jgi:alginate O-acetyltransferase complex protein AlgI
MGGNRKGKARLYVHLFTTMLLGGLWHGASWGFAVWGAFHGCLLVIERVLNAGEFRSTWRGAHIAKALLVFTCISLGWLLFKLPHHHAWDYVRQLFTCGSPSYNPVLVLNIILYSFPVIGYHLYPTLTRRFPVVQKGAFIYFAFMLFLILTNSGSPEKFIYFQF